MNRALLAIGAAALALTGAGSGLLLSSVSSALTASDTSIFCSRFVTAEHETWQPGKVLAKWASQNPGERSAWDSFASAICAGQTPGSPLLATSHGRALVAAGEMARPESPPPTTTTSTTTTTTTTTPTTTTPPSSTPIPSDGVIRAGGIYASSNFAGQVTIATTAAVTIANTRLTYKSATMIKTSAGTPPDLTLDHCTIEGDVWRILDVDAFKRVRLLNNSIERTAGITLVGNGDVTLKFNRHHNIQRVPGGVGNFLQVRLWTTGTFEVAWNEIVNEYNQSDPEDLFSIYHSSNTWWHDNYLQGQFYPGNGPGSSQNGITLDGYGGSGQPVDNNRIEDNILVRTLSIAVFPTSTGPARGNRFLRNRVVNAGFLDDGVTRNYYGYQGMSVKPGGTDNQAHDNVLGAMKGTSQGSGRGNDGEFSGEPRGNGNGIDTGAWSDNFHMAPVGGTITRAMEDAEWGRWQQKLTANGVAIGT